MAEGGSQRDREREREKRQVRKREKQKQETKSKNCHLKKNILKEKKTTTIERLPSIPLMPHFTPLRPLRGPLRGPLLGRIRQACHLGVTDSQATQVWPAVPDRTNTRPPIVPSRPLMWRQRQQGVLCSPPGHRQSVLTPEG